MKALVVSATPEPQSFVASMARTSCEVLERKGYEVATSNLYQMNWNPVASADDFGRRANPNYLTYALEQRTAFRPRPLPRISSRNWTS